MTESKIVTEMIASVVTVTETIGCAVTATEMVW
jgi:hypothetical protein